MLKRIVAVVFAVFPVAMSAHAVTFDWVTVGAPGNACEVQPSSGPIPGGCFGAVTDVYRISKTEVTNAQYAGFLNAVAATDTNALYSTSMGSGFGGITRSGISGSFSYSAIVGRESMPVNFVSFWDSLRFANWLHNGQGGGDTETGAYTITPAGITANSITRNAGATVFLTSEDEWYKAAYFNGTSYFDYPAGSDVETGCVLPGADTGNSANCWPATSPGGALTDVGAYTLSGSPNGTFDQGGNVWEWNEAIISGSGRGVRGGPFNGDPALLAASIRLEFGPANEFANTGFRVASLPEPGVGLLLSTGLLGLALRRRSRGDVLALK